MKSKMLQPRIRERENGILNVDEHETIVAASHCGRPARGYLWLTLCSLHVRTRSVCEGLRETNRLSGISGTKKKQTVLYPQMHTRVFFFCSIKNQPKKTTTTTKEKDLAATI